MPYLNSLSRRVLGMAALCLGISPTLSAATLKDALDHAWAANMPVQSSRTQQFDAEAMAADAWLPAPPSLTLSGQTDQLDRNEGLREWEAEMGVPLWLPGQRDRAAAVAQSARDASLQGFVQQRWMLAGSLREAWWDTRLASAELEVAQSKLAEVTRLEADAQLRLKSGDLAPFDANLARLNLGQTQAELKRAEAVLAKATVQYRSISRGAPLPDQVEEVSTPIELDQHPKLSSLSAAVAAARARLDQANGDTRDNPELALTLTRERQTSDDAYENLAKLSLKIPFGGDSRNRPRITAASADLAEAQLTLETAHNQLAADVESSRIDLEQAGSELTLQRGRLQLAEQNFKWLKQAFRAGQRDLPSLIRGEGELADARLQLARAQIHHARMVSRYNQAIGVLP